MNREFKVGDLVYGNVNNETIFLSKVSSEDVSCGSLPIVVDVDGEPKTFTKSGRHLHGEPFPSLFHANEETYEALVTLYGEENVPPLPSSRHKIIVELLEKQKIVVCAVSDISYEDALNNCDYRFIEFIDESSEPPYIYAADNLTNWKYAIAVDLNGNEITELSGVGDTHTQSVI